ncbi:serine hydrolase domain-containing protein [Labrys okinawensis]|uniref:serine hydrolase domain-containing protein n=1 Tax=Labrys okinawensis TaxID=346911 RepID=UPI0039BD4E67
MGCRRRIRSSDAWAYRIASGRRPRPFDYKGPRTAYDYLQTVGKQGKHGVEFAYKSINTDVMAWVMARVTGHSFARLLQERLWAPLGCEEDGYVIVDPTGTPLAGGGLSATLRDLARFGELIRRQGDWNGKQLIPAFAVDDLYNCDHPAKLSGGYTYRSMWWITHNELGAIEARGLYGQRIHIAPKADMVVARFASHPLAPARYNDVLSVPQMLALGQMLRG